MARPIKSMTDQQCKTMIILGVPDGWSVRHVNEYSIHGFVLFDELGRAMLMAASVFELLYPTPGNLRYFEQAARRQFVSNAEKPDRPNFFIYENAKLG